MPEPGERSSGVRVTRVRHEYANLDLLRATAVMLVFGSHLMMVLGHIDDSAAKIVGVHVIARMGVLIFFIHTSLVLMMSLERLDGAHLVTRFYARRIFRIYPVAILTVFASLIFRIPAELKETYIWPGWPVIWQNLLLIQNLFGSRSIAGVMWSLPLEVEMYVVLPLLFFASRRVRSRLGAVALMASGFLLWYFARSVFIPWFFMGVFAYCLYRLSTPRLSARVYIAILPLFALSPSLIFRLAPSDEWAIYIQWGVGVLFACALPLFHEIQSPALKKAAHVIARYSYGIYLAHMPIMWFIFHVLSGPWALRIPLFLILVGTIPPLLYHMVEAPMIGFGIRFADWLGTSPEPSRVAASAGS